MKKNLCFLAVVAFLATMPACGKTEESSVSSETTETVEVLRDLTVEAEDTLALTDEEKAEAVGVTSEMDILYTGTPENLLENSTNVIEGQIQEVTYITVEEDGLYSPLTKVDVFVYNTVYGDLQEGDLISVYMFGGYIEASKLFAREYEMNGIECADDSIVYETLEGVDLPDVGESYLFFLTPKEEYRTAIPDGAYTLPLGYAHNLYVKTEDGTYVNELNDYSVTSTELTRLIEEVL